VQATPPPPREGPTFELSVSSTIVYRFAPAEFRELVKAVEDGGQLGPLTGAVAGDFEVARSSVLRELTDRDVSRHTLKVELSPEPDQPIFSHVDDDLCAVVSVSARDHTLAVTLNVCLAEISADQLVALAHSMYGRTATAPVLRVRPPALGSTPATETAAHSIEQVHSAIAEHLTVSGRPKAASHFRCVEIRRMGDRTDAREAIAAYPLPLYGVLTADEGWRYVDRHTATTRLANVWGTRHFVGIVGMGDACLMLNFRSADFGTSQNAFLRRHFDHVEPYFDHRYRFAGLEHGTFFALELCAYRKCVVDDLQYKLDQRRTLRLSLSVFGDIREQARRQSLYRSLVEDLVRLRDHPPTELGALVDVIETGSGLPERLTHLRHEMQALETEEQMLYLHRVNRLLVVVAWIGVVVALVGLVVAAVFGG
jgi:hypothetical protein